METRILVEVEEMINKVREQHDRPFDVSLLITSCVANVMMNMLYGRRFGHSDPAFQQLLCDLGLMVSGNSLALSMFSWLRYFPFFQGIKAAMDCFETSIANDYIVNCIQVCGHIDTVLTVFN